MPDATLFAQYRAIMQNTAILGLYRELLALLRAAAREFSRQAGDTWRVSALHTGELDVSYFTVVTPAASRRKAKYVVAFVHATMTFELWLSAANQKAWPSCRLWTTGCRRKTGCPYLRNGSPL